MDFHRPNRHFKLSEDPRQPQTQPAPEPAGVAPIAEEPKEVIQADAQVETPSVDFVPPPPEVPAAEPPVIESMQTVSEPITEPEPELKPESDPSPEAKTEAESHVLPATPSVPPKIVNGVPIKFVVVGALLIIIAFIGVVFWQQQTISRLENDLRLQSEQLKVVNPVSAGVDETTEE